jgi:hypothetical protein
VTRITATQVHVTAPRERHSTIIIITITITITIMRMMNGRSDIKWNITSHHITSHVFESMKVTMKNDHMDPIFH